MRDFFVLNALRPGAHMVMILDGPNIVIEDGKGIQLIMTVAFDTAQTPRTAPTPAQPAIPDRHDYDATPAEYAAAAPGEQFARAVVDVCAKVAAGGSFAGIPDVTPLPGPPSFFAEYPATTWYALAASPRNVFLSLDAVPGRVRCRVVLANNTRAPSEVHQATIAALQRARARVIAPIAYEAHLKVNESAWLVPAGVRATLFLVQSVPNTEKAGRGQQITATARSITQAEGRTLGVTF